MGSFLEVNQSEHVADLSPPGAKELYLNSPYIMHGMVLNWAYTFTRVTMLLIKTALEIQQGKCTQLLQPISEVSSTAVLLQN